MQKDNFIYDLSKFLSVTFPKSGKKPRKEDIELKNKKETYELRFAFEWLPDGDKDRQETIRITLNKGMPPCLSLKKYTVFRKLGKLGTYKIKDDQRLVADRLPSKAWHGKKKHLLFNPVLSKEGKLELNDGLKKEITAFIGGEHAT